jgi:hypothetical protein
MEPKAKQRRDLAVLAVALGVLAVTLYFTVLPRTAAVTRRASNEKGGRPSRTAGAPVTTSPDVRLEALTAERPKPRNASRNLFRFKPPPPPPPPPVRKPPPVVTPPIALGPPAPSPLPPIALKLTGVGSQGTGPRIAFLTDAFGRSIVAREGEAIEGRYKVLRINESSVEVAYLDGRGRQTLRAGP